MHFGDSIFIFLLALVLFGPKKLPEIGRTIGKLLGEFRRASNEFKFQIQEELRNMEDEERRTKLAEAQAKKAASEALPAPDSSLPVTPTILPPSVGAQVSTSAPYSTPVAAADPTPIAPAVAPSDTEIIVDPSAPDLIAPASEPSLPPAAQAAPHLDLTAHSNGSHPPEPVESAAPSESVHHG